MHLLPKLLSALAVLATSASMANPVVFSQAWNGANTIGYSSQNEIGARGDFSKTYDNFRLASNTSITDIHWTGVWFNPSTHGSQTSALVQIWANSGSSPGALLYSETVSGTANETALSGQTYTYDADLAVDFLALAGTTYWLSIQSATTPGPQWGWSQGTGGDNRSVQRFFSSTNVNGVDLAFRLDGLVQTSVPEPSSLLLAGLALLGMCRPARGRPR